MPDSEVSNLMVNRPDPSMESYIARKERAAKLFKARLYADSLSIYESLAAQQDVDSQIFVGWMNYSALGTKRNDAGALAWFERAAAQGSVRGMFYCGRLLTALGRHEESRAWYERAASKGFAPAQFRLGVMYNEGKGVPVDTGIAREYFDRAARSGHLFARRALGLLYLKGVGGFWMRMHGLFLLVSAVITAIWVALTDKYSDELRW